MMGNNGSIVLKLYMIKAFDRVKFKINFPSISMDLIMSCIIIVSYSVLVNGEKYEPFIPKRGLYQGSHCHLIFFSCVLKG